MVHVGKMLVYLSLLFSFASAAQYVRLFRDAVDAKERAREGANADAVRASEAMPPEGR
jgi:CDP-diacylglycerol--glycerol-3-phosphate 3-phosphatidyltransferase